MKRTLAITLTVALIGSLMFMGFAGTAAAQNIDIGDVDQELESGDAINYAEVDQNNNNAQVGTSDATATSGPAVASSSGGAAAAEPKHHGGSAAGAGGGATAGSAAFADATTTQVQDVDQTNQANIEQDAETGDVTGEQFTVDVDIADFNDNGDE